MTVKEEGMGTAITTSTKNMGIIMGMGTGIIMKMNMSIMITRNITARVNARGIMEMLQGREIPKGREYSVPVVLHR